ncbi:MAG: hypothetical protein ACXVIU_12265 [Halobacteriota archaeon]
MEELDYVREVGKNPLLAYTLLHTIDKFQHIPLVAPEILAKFNNQAFKCDEPRYTLTPSRFYRILFLINKSCEKKGFDLRLPYYWFKSGPVVHRRDAPRVFSVIRIATTQQVVASYDKWKDTVLIFDRYESSFSDAILLTLEVGRLARFTRLDVIFEYSRSKLHKALVAMINEFQNVSKKEVVDEKDVDTFAKMLANVVEGCAEKRYSELCPSFERAAEQIQTQIAARSNMRDVWRVIQDMWNLLSLGLRARENNNINEKQVQDWEHKYALALSAFKQRL